MFGIETYVFLHDKSIGWVHLALKHFHVVLIEKKTYFRTKNAGAIGQNIQIRISVIFGVKIYSILLDTLILESILYP